MSECSMVPKVYVKLNKDKFFKSINKDLEIIQYREEVKNRAYGIMGVISVITAMILCWLFRSKCDMGWISSIVVSIILGLLVEFMEYLFYFLYYAVFMSYGYFLYTEEFRDTWQKGCSIMKSSADSIEVCKWLMTLPDIGKFIPNANFINIIINHDFLCDVEEDEGSIWDKVTGERITFDLDCSLLTNKFKKTDGDDLILIITEKYHYLMDIYMYGSDASCEILESTE